MNVICGQEECQYRKGVYCGLDFVMLNNFGQCEVWFDKRGGRRIIPDYRGENRRANECKADKTNAKSAEGVLQRESVEGT